VFSRSRDGSLAVNNKVTSIRSYEASTMAYSAARVSATTVSRELIQNLAGAVFVGLEA